MTAIEQHILSVLATTGGNSRPVTVGDFARRFGVNPAVVRSAARQLVVDGLARPSMIVMDGEPTLHGLLPLLPAEVATAAEPLAPALLVNE